MTAAFSNRRAALDFRRLWALTFLGRAGALVFPFLTPYLLEARALTAAQTGTVVSMWGVGYLTAGPAGAATTCRWGLKRVFILSAIVSTFALSTLHYARTFELLALAAFLLGLGNELFRPALVMAVNETVKHGSEQSAQAGVFWAANLGITAASMLGSILVRSSYEPIFTINILTTGFICVGFVRFFKDSFGEIELECSLGEPRIRIRRPSAVLPRCAATFMVTAVLFQWTSALPMEIARSDMDAAYFGQLLTVNAATVCALQPLVWRGLSGASSRLLLRLGSALIGIGFCLHGLLHGIFGHFLAVVIWTVGEVLFCPTSVIAVSDGLSRKSALAANGWHQLAVGAGYVMAPAAGTFCWQQMQCETFWTGCGCLCVTASIVYSFTTPKVSSRALAPLLTN